MIMPPPFWLFTNRHRRPIEIGSSRSVGSPLTSLMLTVAVIMFTLAVLLIIYQGVLLITSHFDRGYKDYGYVKYSVCHEFEEMEFVNQRNSTIWGDGCIPVQPGEGIFHKEGDRGMPLLCVKAGCVPFLSTTERMKRSSKRPKQPS